MALTVDPTGLRISWASLPDRDYAVQYKVDLNSLAWTNIGSISSIGTVSNFEDTDSTRLSQPRGFYQVMLAR